MSIPSSPPVRRTKVDSLAPHTFSRRANLLLRPKRTVDTHLALFSPTSSCRLSSGHKTQCRLWANSGRNRLMSMPHCDGACSCREKPSRLEVSEEGRTSWSMVVIRGGSEVECRYLASCPGGKKRRRAGQPRCNHSHCSIMVSILLLQLVVVSYLTSSRPTGICPASCAGEGRIIWRSPRQTGKTT